VARQLGGARREATLAEFFKRLYPFDSFLIVFFFFHLFAARLI
jgi:hypothetical protein